MTEPVTLTLKEPITVRGAQLTELTIRPPTGKDLRQCGYPFIIGNEGVQIIDAAAVSKLLVNCAQIPSSSVDQMGPGDWTAGMTAIMGFFTPPDSTPPAP